MTSRVSLRALLALVLLAATHVLAAAADVAIVRVFSGWRDADSFKRISEYFTGRENTGDQVVLRTRPDERAGYYFLVRLANPGAATDVRLRLEVVRPQEREPAVHTFAAPLAPGATVFNLGLTGTDWPDAKANPVAWKLEVLGADGATILATAKSFLWDKPAGD